MVVVACRLISSIFASLAPFSHPQLLQGNTVWCHAELDEAVGAFVRAIQEAPPNLARGAALLQGGADSGSAAPAPAAAFGGGGLGGSGPAQLGGSGQRGAMTLQDGLEQLSRFQAGLEAL